MMVTLAPIALRFRSAALVTVGIAIAMSGCGGSSGSDQSGRLSLRALWEQPVTDVGSAAPAAAGQAFGASGGFGRTLPKSVRIVRFSFASASGATCCVAVDPTQTPVDPESGLRVLVLDQLPAGPATLAIAGF